MADPHKYQQSYDLVNDYDWTSVARKSQMRNEAPSAYVSAYALKFSQLRSFIDGYLNILSPTHFGTINKKGGTRSANPGLDFYRRLYGTSSDPLTRFSFPFFSDNIRSFSTEYADTFSPVSQRGAQMLGGEFLTGLGGAGESVIGGAAALASGIANLGGAAGNSGDKSLVDKVSKASVKGASSLFNKAFGTNVDFNAGMQTIGAPGTYIETPKFYQYSNTDNGLELSFALSNTLNNDAIEQNHRFITDFTRMNRPFRTGAIGMTFPAIYNIVIPGQRYIQWAYLESFNIGLLGMRRRLPISTGGSRIVPEAYTCQFSFRSLTIEAANFMDEIDKFGGFDSGDDSYIKLKRAEEASIGSTAANLDRAARIREAQNNVSQRKIDPNPTGGDPNWTGLAVDGTDVRSYEYFSTSIQDRPGAPGTFEDYLLLTDEQIYNLNPVPGIENLNTPAPGFEPEDATIQPFEPPAPGFEPEDATIQPFRELSPEQSLIEKSKRREISIGPIPARAEIEPLPGGTRSGSGIPGT